MGVQKTRADFLLQLNDPASGINSSRTTDLTITQHNVILDDFIASAFFLSTDTTDNILEGSTNKFLTTLAQTFDGVKTFTSSPITNLGITLKEVAGDANTVRLTGNSSMTSSYVMKFPAIAPSAGEIFRVSSFTGGVATMEFSPAGGGTINSGIENRLAVFATGTTINDSGTGTSSGTTVLLPSQTGRVFSIPSITGGSANFVLSEDNQIINGNKDFQGITNLKGFTIESDTSGKITFNATGVVTPYTLTFPNAQGGANSLVSNNAGTVAFVTAATPGSGNINGFVIDNSNIRLHFATQAFPGIVSTSSQVFNGEKTFDDGIVVGVGSRTVKFTDGSFTTTLRANPISNQTYVLPVSDGSTGQFLQTDGAGNWSFATVAGSGTVNTGIQGRIPIYSTTGTTLDDQATVGAGIVDVEIASQTGNRTYSIPDAGLSADFLLSEGAQTINGSKTFSATILMSATSSQMILGTGNTVAISAPTPSANRTYTIPDIGTGLANFIMSEGNQTLNGLKTFASGLSATSGAFTDVGNQLVFGTINTTTINSIDAGGAKTYSIPNVGTTADFILSEGAQVINGTKSYSSPILVTNTSSALDLASIGGFSAIIAVDSHSTIDRTYNIPDAGTNANFVLSEGASTIGGLKTFTGGLSVDTTNVTLTDVNLVLSTTTGTIIGTSPVQKLGLWGATPVEQPAPLTSQLTTILQSGIFTPDYTIQAVTNTSPFGFVTADEAETFISVVRNLQVRIAELEARLQSYGGLA